MSLKAVTYCKQYRRANVHTVGCNFKCKGCPYESNKEPMHQELGIEQVTNALKSLNVKWVHFVGGEPTLCQNIGSIATFCHEELSVKTKIGHSMGWNMPPDDIDAMHITIKAYSDKIHREYTGVSNSRVLDHFKRIYDQGITVTTNTVFIPDLIDVHEVGKIARFIAEVDPQIPFHIIGYMPVQGMPWRSPEHEEMEDVKQTAENYLEEVTTSCFQSLNEYHRKVKENPVYQSVRVA